MIVVSTKDNKNRVIRLGEDVVKSLKAHQERQFEHIASAHGLWKDPELVFASTIGTRLDPSNLVERSFKPLLKRARLPDMRIHDLRVTPAPPCYSPKVKCPSRWLQWGEGGGDHHLIAKRSEGFAHQLLVGERTVDFRSVEEGDTTLHGGSDQRGRLLPVCSRTVTEV